MIKTESISDLVAESIRSLRRSGIIEVDIEIEPSTVILGGDCSLDSMGFVTLITDVEERLNRATGKDLYIVLTDLEVKFVGQNELTIAMLVEYLSDLCAG